MGIEGGGGCVCEMQAWGDGWMGQCACTHGSVCMRVHGSACMRMHGSVCMRAQLRVHEEKNKFMTSSKERIAGLEAWVCVM